MNILGYKLSLLSFKVLKRVNTDDRKSYMSVFGIAREGNRKHVYLLDTMKNPVKKIKSCFENTQEMNYNTDNVFLSDFLFEISCFPF